MAVIKNETWLRSLARSYTEANIRTLGGYANSPEVTDDIRLRAIGMLMDRGWGRPAQTQETTVKGALEVTIRDIMAEKQKSKT